MQQYIQATLRQTRAWASRSVIALGLLGGLCAACDDDGAYVSVGAGRRIPGSPIDGGTQIEAGPEVPDGSVLLPDGAIIKLPTGNDDDAGGMDTDPMGFDPTPCKVDAETGVALDAIFSSEGGFALASGYAGVPGFGLVEVTPGTKDCAKSISSFPVPAIGELAKPALVLDECKEITELTLLSTKDGWRLGWVDNFTDRAEMHTMLPDDELKLSATSKRQTLGKSSLVEHFPASTNLGETPLFAWITHDVTSGKRGISAQLLDGSSSSIELLSDDAGHVPVRLALAQVGESNGVLAWVEEVAEQGVWLQKLGPKGDAIDPPAHVSGFVYAGSSLDLATREEDGGALIYSAVVNAVNHEVRFRRLDEDGELITQDIKIVTRPQQGQDASLARVGGGYVVAYRALPVANTEITTPQIRLMFISKEGNVARDSAGRPISYLVTKASRDGGRVTICLSNDGQLLISYVDVVDGVKKLKLTRKRLDCAR